MKIDFSLAQDGNKTFTANGIFYHSKYSPAKEAERFSNTIKQQLPADFLAKLILIIEPGIDYCSNLIKKSFTDCKIAAIRLFTDYKKTEFNSSFDYDIPYNAGKGFSQLLIDCFGEELLLASAIFIWPAAKNIFSTQIQQLLTDYKSALEESKTLLVTRQFFEKKWLINSCSFINYSKKLVLPKINDNQNIVITASGPSLEPCIDILKKYKTRFLLICLSSAVPVLLHNQIIPDFILSTDGGFWAGQHLKALKNFCNIPVAAPSEAFIPKIILASNPIIPLKYKDSGSFISNTILEKAGINGLDAVRNPTVSGTALFLGLTFNPKNIFFCGLDLAASYGFAHTNPNELEINNSLNDNRINAKNNRITRACFSSDSLKLYENWFACFENKGQIVKRVIESNYKKNELGNIPDISIKDFETFMSSESEQNNQIKFQNQTYQSTGKAAIFKFLLDSLSDSAWQKQLFPADFISMQNSNNEAAIQRLNQKLEKLKNKIRTFIQDGNTDL